ncbi:intradiol ring-cleavage dioxygenase [Piscinibacter sakaiensis]|uniref:Putative dioxygenase n=1 Tax=Piscinibacter sakaiensis TaxID=1547922 RepID=A0A0K8P342_PISS1|nr:intradiol ring-cleavage dioxygenase [Piscinibacter sakaiensis]GAP37061.1 putative dioxygenase [Piscinibacter sakaiensis]
MHRHPAAPAHPPRDEDHGHGLADDLPRLLALAAPRRRVLSWLATVAGSAALGGCGGGGSSDTVDTSTSTTTTGTSGSSGSGSSSTGTTTTTSGSCIADPQETAGPYPADGTNTASGSTSDVLTAAGIVRSDIRSSFLGSTNIAQGVPVVLTLTLVDTNASCAPLAGYAIYLWHCDRAGNYSLYTAASESYLRGVQVSDSAGQVTFTTIFPGCYAGRWPHIHFEVFASQAAATTGRNAVLISQLALPSAVCSAVYPAATGYSASVGNFAGVSLSGDNVFGDNTAAQLAAMTPSFSGSVSDGYTASATIGIAR